MQLELHTIYGNAKVIHSHLVWNCWFKLLKINKHITLTIRPNNPTPRYFISAKNFHTNLYTNIYSDYLELAKPENSSKCHFKSEIRINRLWYIYDSSYYANKKGTTRTPNNTDESRYKYVYERSKRGNATYFVILLTQRILKKAKTQNIKRISGCRT